MDFENKQLRDEMESLKSRDEIRGQEIHTLQQQISRLVTDGLQQTNINDVIDSKGRQEAARDTRHITRRENEMNVAFFAGLTNHLTHLGENQHIISDHVITNNGNDYNNHAGDFRAPVSGTYVFSVTLMAYTSHTTHYSIAKNGGAVSNIYLRGQESPHATSSMTAILELQQGDDVAIINIDTDEYLHGSTYIARSLASSLPRTSLTRSLSENKRDDIVYT